MTVLSDEEKYKELASIIQACVKRDLTDKEAKYIKWLSGRIWRHLKYLETYRLR